MNTCLRALRVVWILSAAGSLARAQAPAVRLDVGDPPGATSSFLPEIAASGTSVYATWEDLRNGLADVYFNRSLDGGATWLANDVRLDVGDAPGAETSAAPQIAASGASVYVTWEDVRDGRGDIYFNRSLDGGATWLPNDVRLDVSDPPGAAISTLPRIACVGASVYVTWQEFRNGAEDIYFNRSLDGGATWLALDVRLDTGDPPGASRSGMPQIAATSASVYVTYWDARNGSNTDVYFNRSLDGGTTWLPSDVRLDLGSPPGAAASDAPRIAVDRAAVYVVWQDQRNGLSDIYLNASPNRGTTWLAADVRLDVGSAPGAVTSDTPEIAAALPYVYVTWREGPSIRFNRSLDSGTTWFAADIGLNFGVEGVADPQIATSGIAVYVTWEERVNSVSEIHFNRSVFRGDPGTWLPLSVRLDTGVGGASLHPQLAASGASIYTAFQSQQSTGNWDAYFVLALGFQPYGSGTPGSGGIVPTLSGSSHASIGGTLAVDPAKGLGGAIGVVFAGMNGRASIPIDGGLLLVQPPVLRKTFKLSGMEGMPGVGTTNVGFAIPNELALIGTRMNFQARISDPGVTRRTAGGQIGFAFTNGLEAWIL